MPTSKHACPGGCGQSVGYRYYACGDCWTRLPGALKGEILRAFRHRREDPRPHVAAMLAAGNWYRAHPVSTVGGVGR